jgi:hypothetical protein
MHIPTKLYQRSGNLEVNASALNDIMQSIISALKAKGAVVSQVSDSQLHFDSHIWFPGWELLLPISSGTINVTVLENKATVTYHLSFWRTFIVCVGFTTITFILALIGFMKGWVIILVPGIWGWIYLMNLVMTSIRFRQMLERSIEKPSKG